MKRSPIIGGIFLVAGTAIGAGMLALPITTGTTGFYPALFIFLLAASFMLYNLLLLLEINFWMPYGSDFISMSRKILGKTGGIVTWIAYLLLLYTVIAAYTAGGAPFIQSILEDWAESSLPSWLGVILFLLFLGSFVYLGTNAVSRLNRLLVSGLIATFVILVFLGVPKVHLEYLKDGNSKYLWGSIPVIVFSFTSHLIVPSLRDYFKDHVKKLVFILVIGSLIPLIFYVIWEVIILGVIPFQDLKTIAINPEPLLKLTNTLMQDLGFKAIGLLTTLFAFFALVTSFLGVSVSLSHFLADGFKLRNRFLTLLLTFLPPLFFVLFYPEGFIAAFKYAGICIIVLFGILTPLMTWKGRYIDKRPGKFRVFGGKPALIIAFILAIFILSIEISDKFSDWLPDIRNETSAA